jgi:hypothetical protein
MKKFSWNLSIRVLIERRLTQRKVRQWLTWKENLLVLWRKYTGLGERKNNRKNNLQAYKERDNENDEETSFKNSARRGQKSGGNTNELVKRER